MVLVVNFKLNIKSKVVHAYKSLTLFVFVYCDEDQTYRLPSGKGDINIESCEKGLQGKISIVNKL